MYLYTLVIERIFLGVISLSVYGDEVSQAWLPAEKIFTLLQIICCLNKATVIYTNHASNGSLTSKITALSSFFMWCGWSNKSWGKRFRGVMKCDNEHNEGPFNSFPPAVISVAWHCNRPVSLMRALLADCHELVLNNDTLPKLLYVLDIKRNKF